MWVNLLIGVALSYVAYLLSPKPTPPDPASLDDFDIPKSDEGSEIGIAHGSPWVTSMHVHWFGDFGTVAIKEKVGK